MIFAGMKGFFGEVEQKWKMAHSWWLRFKSVKENNSYIEGPKACVHITKQDLNMHILEI